MFAKFLRPSSWFQNGPTTMPDIKGLFIYKFTWVWQYSIFSWHSVPWNPGEQMQIYPLSWSTHLPLFRQGAGIHSSTSTSHPPPVYPSKHYINQEYHTYHDHQHDHQHDHHHDHYHDHHHDHQHDHHHDHHNDQHHDQDNHHYHEHHHNHRYVHHHYHEHDFIIIIIIILYDLFHETRHKRKWSHVYALIWTNFFNMIIFLFNKKIILKYLGIRIQNDWLDHDRFHCLNKVDPHIH